MQTKEEILAFLRDHRTELRRRFHVARVGLFGSFAKDLQTEESDVDLLIELEENTAGVYTLKRELAQYLEEAFGRHIDLAREKYLKPYAKEAILKETIYV